MESRRAWVVASMASWPSERLMALPPSGRGRPVSLAPPCAEVEHLLQAVGRVGELAFVDQQARVELARDDGGDDLVEGHDDGLNFGVPEL